MNESPEKEVHETNSNAGYEKSDVNVGKVILYGAVIALIVIVSVIGLWQFFTAEKERLVYDVVLKIESAKLRDLRARETEELNSYAVLDERKGTYRIPIERAMKLMAEEAYREKAEGN
ncbi:MAG: hypothetical protein GF307_10470 [candidate division Zixibacteria bacterium]|nr:hypothetical protein [candidate division Zixibacteria bacterium]